MYVSSANPPGNNYRNFRRARAAPGVTVRGAVIGMRRLWRLVRVLMDGLGYAVTAWCFATRHLKTNDVPVCIAKPGRAVYAIGAVAIRDA
jgi:hypothetical protein